MYHPTLGRWMQRDPIGYADGMSLYQYCRSGPLVSVDPRGLAVNGTLREDTVTVYDTQSSWDAVAKATELEEGANATAVPWMEAEVEGKYDPAHPCDCYFHILSIDLGISIHIAGRRIVVSRGSAGIPTIGGRITGADVELAKMHEGFHREQFIAVWEKYRRQLSEWGGCRYWRGWGPFRGGYVQSPELCGERADKLEEYLADQLYEYLKHAGLFFDARYASPQTAARLKSTQAATMKEIATMTMRDWNCDDTSLGWFR